MKQNNNFMSSENFAPTDLQNLAEESPDHPAKIEADSQIEKIDWKDLGFAMVGLFKVIQVGWFVQGCSACLK